jgi:hypothetical protein
MFLSTIIFPATSDKTSYRNNGDSGGTFSDRGDSANENGSGDGVDDDEDSISVGVDAS